MDFGLLPPEVNSGLMYAGPGAGSLLTAAVSWNAVAAQLEATASGYSSTISDLTGLAWFGPSSMRMAAAAALHVLWLQATAAHAGQSATPAYAAAAAYELAFAMTVPPSVVAANRAQLMVLIATNFFGQNTAAIAATEAQYAEMWVQDASAMYGYAAASEAASTLTPYDEPPQTTNPAGRSEQASALARSVTDTASAETQSVIQQLSAGPLGPGTYGPGTYSLPSGGTLQIDPGSSLILVDSIINNGLVDGNGTLTIGGNSTVTVAGALGIEGGGHFTIMSSTVVVNQGASLGPITGGDIVITSSTFTLDSGIATTQYGGLITINNGVLSTSGPAIINGSYEIGPAGGLGSAGPVLGGAAAPASTSPLLGPTSGLSAATPGLAGNAAIQPQVNIDALAVGAE